MDTATHRGNGADHAAGVHGRVYRDLHLGKLSSHPRWLAEGSRWLRRAAVAPAGLLYSAALYLWLRGHSPQDLLPALAASMSSRTGLWSAGAVAFVLGMSAAAAFQLRVAVHKVGADDIRADDRLRWSPGMIAACLLAGLVLPLALTLAPGAPFELRLFGALLALAPAATLSYLLPAAGERAPFPWFSILLLLPALGTVAFSAQASAWVADRAPEWLTGHFPVLAEVAGWRRLAIVLAAATGAVAAFRLAAWNRGRALEAALRRDSPAAERPRESLWRRVLRWLGLGFLLGGRGAKGEAVSVDEAPPWLRAVEGRSGLVLEDRGWLAPTPEESADLAKDDRHDFFFDGMRPTVDQFKALEDFLALRRESVRATGDGSVRGGFDMVLEGPPGSGRTAVLDAMALVSILSNGSRTLLLVSDEGKVDFSLRRIRGKIERLGMKEFLVAGRPSEAIGALRRGEAPPEIVVATAAGWEGATSGNPVRSGAEFQGVRRALLLYGNVLVDDWSEHPSEIRVHLPFVVDKHRLLLETEMRLRSAVYVFPRLTEAGRGLAISRLAGDTVAGDRGRQLHRLRYRALDPARVFDVEAGEGGVNASLECLLDACGSEGVSAVLMRRGIDLEESKRQTEAWRIRHGGAEISICYCGDQVADEIGGISGILLKASEGSDAVFSLRSRKGGSEPLFLRVRGAGDSPPPTGITPLLAHRSGRGLAEGHLRSFLRFLPPANPAPLRAWGQLGLRVPGVARPPSREVAPGGARLFLDLPSRLPAEKVAARPYLNRFDGFVALAEGYDQLEICDPWSIPTPPPPPSLAVGGLGLPESLLLANAAPDLVESNCLAAWKGNEGSKLGSSQLPYLEELVLRRGGAFAPGSQRQDAEGRLEFEAVPFKGDGSDLIHPKVELSWVAASVPAEPGGSEEPGEPGESGLSGEGIEIGHGGPAHRFLWLGAGREGGEVRVSASMVERCDDADRPGPGSETFFAYHATARPLLLLPEDTVVSEMEGLREAARALFRGGGGGEGRAEAWGTGHGAFLPGFSYAFARAMFRDLPGVGLFGKVLCFELRGEENRCAAAVAWFLEPAGTGRTLSHAFDRLLREEGYLECFAGFLETTLEQGWDGAPASDLAKFWLPRRRRVEVSDFERNLASRLRCPPC